MNEEKQPIPVKAASLMRRAVIYAVLLLVVFLVGFVPMWFKVRECSSSLSQAENTLSMAKMENALASAAIDARRGDYEPARQSASAFLLRCGLRLTKGMIRSSRKHKEWRSSRRLPRGMRSSL
ncbi:MAG: hypothetical protein P8Y80_11080 [Acidobacteriota bacterium]|jgi:hypothetical protein